MKLPAVLMFVAAALLMAPNAAAQGGAPIPDYMLPGLDGCEPFSHDHNGHTSTHWHSTHRETFVHSDGNTYTHCNNSHGPIPTDPPQPRARSVRVLRATARSYGTQPIRALRHSDCMSPDALRSLQAGVGGLVADWQGSDPRCRYTVQYAYYVFDDSHCEDGRWDDCLPTLGSQINIGSVTTTGDLLDASIPSNRRIAAVRVSGSDRWSSWEYVDEPGHPSRRWNYCRNLGGGLQFRPVRSRCVPNPSGGTMGVECDIASTSNGRYIDQTNRDADQNGVPDPDPEFGADCVGTMNFNPCLNLTGVCPGSNSAPVRQQGSV